MSADQSDPNPLNDVANEQTMVEALAACAAPSLSGPVLHAAGGPPINLASGDFNEDGADDLVVWYANSSQLGILLSNGAGGFGPATPFVVAAGGTPSGARWVTVVDINNDGHLDLVVSNTIANTVTVARGDGQGNFAHTFTSSVLAAAPGRTTAGQFSADGFVDLVIETPQGALMMLSLGADIFGAPTSVGGQTNVRLFAGHFNADANLDLVFGSAGAPTLRVFNGNGQGGFTNVTLYPTNAASAVVGVADVTGDGRADVLLESLLTPGLLTLVHSTPTGLGAETTIGTGLFLSQIADVNGDGHMDLVVSGSVTVLRGNGTGTFEAPVRLVESPSADAAGDFNGDGRVDFAGTSGVSVAVLLNTCGQPATNLSIQLTDAPDPASEGSPITYSATIDNISTGNATGVRVTVSADAGLVPLTFSAVDPACVVDGNGLLCNVGPVPAGTDRTLEFNITAAAGATVTVRASVTSEQADTNAADNSDVETTTVSTTGRDIVVTNTNDSGPGSLRQAIQASNSDVGDPDRIVFDIGGGGPQTIALTSPLPTITQPVIIDGTTQQGFAGAPIVEINGAGVGGGSAGFLVNAAGSQIRGLVINRFAGYAIVLQGAAGGSVIQGNYIGTNLAGTAAQSNGGGIALANTPNSTIGGPSPLLRNVISGNTNDGIQISGGSQNFVQGNYIGLDATGSLAIPNSVGIHVSGSPNNVIGGTAAGTGNVVSGNQLYGIIVQPASVGTTIRGNIIGLDAGGNVDRGNVLAGILVNNVAGAIIGGISPGARNVISGNDGPGIRLAGAAATGASIQGNFIGTRADGGAAIGNSGAGIQIENVASGGTIGGTDPSAGNLISGNGLAGISLFAVSNATIQGNRIGTDDLATTNIGNGSNGVEITDGSNNTVGGDTTAARNIISGNGSNGVSIAVSIGTASGNIVRNNFIGTNGSGTSAIRNVLNGVFINGATNTQIGGSGSGNVISGNGQNGIRIFGAASPGTQIRSNWIGTNVFGNQPVPNAFDGIRLDSANGVVIGSAAPADRNIVGGNGQHGIGIYGAGTNNVIQGNTIGGGGSPVNTGNALEGIQINSGSNNTIGGRNANEGNIISFNRRAGVVIFVGAGNAILGNSIVSNTSLGIDFANDLVTANDAGDADVGANLQQNYPVLTAAPGGVTGTLNSTPNTTFQVDFYANASCDASGNGEGETFLGAFLTITTDANGNAVIPFRAADQGGPFITATATNPTNNTSEFSACASAGVAGADLSIVKSDSTDPVVRNTPFTYTLLVHNAGPALASDVGVIDTLPAGVVVSNATITQGSCNIAVAGQVTCTIGTLVSGGDVTITLTATAANAGLITNSVVVTSPTDANTANNTDTEQTMVLAQAACAQPSFSGPTLFPTTTGASLTSFDTGDFNGDGATDLVGPLASNTSHANLLLADGNGGFLAPRVIQVAPMPGGGPAGTDRVTVADVNKDGRPDILAANVVSGTMSVALGDGTGAFTVGFSTAAFATSPQRAFPGDFNGDGNQDVLLTLQGSTAVLLLGDGAGAFGAPIATPFPATLQFTIADFNQDGRADLVLGSPSGISAISLHLGTAAGGFETPISIPTAGVTFGVRAADLNHDSRPDLVLSHIAASAINMTVMLATGPATFGPQSATITTGLTVQNVHDVNGDGHPDIFTTSAAALLGDGTGAFAAPVRLFAALPNGAGDFNGDGRVDFALLSTFAGPGGGQAVALFLNACGQPETDLTLQTSDAPDPAPEGSPVTYTATIDNAGPLAATDVRLNMTFAANNVPLALTANDASCGLQPNGFLCTIGTLPSGGTKVIQFTATAPSAATVTFAAGVTALQADPTPADNTRNGSTVINAIGRDIVVTNTTNSGPGSLRDAITDSNRDTTDVDRIVFDIPGPGPHTIAPTFALPSVTTPAIIDGTTQPGFQGTPIVEVSGAGILSLTNGLTVQTTNSVIRGLVINRFTNAAISITIAGGNVIEGNYLGTNVAGTAALPNFFGVNISNTSNNRIGGTAPGQRNVISGNTVDGVRITGAGSNQNIVHGNYIGVDATGTVAVPNVGGVFVSAGATNTFIGGLAAGAGNVISGNTQFGVLVNIGSTGNIIQANLIGLDVGGTLDRGNGEGIVVDASTGTRIGGTVTEARNVISGNNSNGIRLTGAATSGTFVHGNYLGTDAAGVTAVPNTTNGVQIAGGASSNDIGGPVAGAGNLISRNGVDGIQILDGSNNNIGTSTSTGVNTITSNGRNGITVLAGTGNSILGNSISGNSALGIDLGNDGVTANDAADADSGPNALQNFPVLTPATGGVTGTLASTANTAFRIEFFGNVACDASQHGEGQTFLGTANVTTDGTGNAVIPFFATQAGQFVTATATGQSNATAEFSGCAVSGSAPAPFSVTNTNNEGAGSLRQALLNANASVGTLDTISFNIPGTGPFTIAPTSPLPVVTDPVIIDATTQPGFAGTPRVELSGANSFSPIQSGINLQAGSSTVRGLAINRWNSIGIGMSGPGNVIEGNYIGTDLTGTLARPNTFIGVSVDSSGNRIGGTTPEQRNLISGNGGFGVRVTGPNNFVMGNYIGTNATGTAGIRNEFTGVVVQNTGNTIGGPGAAGNLISGNGQYGVVVAGSNVIRNNLIGTDVGGDGPLGNYAGGVEISGSGATLTENTLASNDGNGVSVNGGTGNNLTANSFFANAGLAIDLVDSAGTPSYFVDFEDHLDSIPVGTPFPAESDGVTWNNWQHYAPYPAAFEPHGTNAVFGAIDGASMTFTPRAFFGARFSRFPGRPGDIYFELYRQGALVWTSATLPEIPSTLMFLPSGYTGVVDEVRVRSLGQSMTPAGGTWIMDDVILGNGVTANDAGDADAGANNLQNFPTLTSATNTTSTRIHGTFNSSANTAYMLQFYASPACDAAGHGEGATLIGSTVVTTNGAGDASFDVTFDPTVTTGHVVTGTATDPNGNTSEFSACTDVADPGLTLVNGAMHTGAITAAGEVDVWTFDAVAGDRIAVHIGEIVDDNDFRPWIRLASPTGAALGDVAGIAADVIDDVVAPVTGTYVVRVASFDPGLDGTGTYRLTMTHTPGPITVSPGDEGGPLTNGAIHTGEIVRGDVDVWTFTATAGERIAVHIGELAETGDFRPWMRLWSPAGASLGDTSGLAAAVIDDVVAPVTGTYLLLVATFDPAFDGAGTYRLTMTHTPGPITVSPGDDGGPLTNGAIHTGEIVRGDVDVWTFTATAGERIAVHIGELAETGDFRPWMRLWSPAGASLGDTSGLAAAVIDDVVAPVTGTYLLLVASFDPAFDGAGTYRLTMTHTPGPITVSAGR